MDNAPPCVGICNCSAPVSAAAPVCVSRAPVYPIDRAPDVVGALRVSMHTAPDEINAAATFWTLPAAPPFPPPLHGRDVVILNATYNGNVERGMQALQPLRTVAEPLFDMSGPIAYTALQQLFDPFFSARELRYYWKGLYTSRLDTNAISTLCTAAERRPSPMSMLVLWALGVRVSDWRRVTTSATRKARSLGMSGIGRRPIGTATCRKQRPEFA